MALKQFDSLEKVVDYLVETYGYKPMVEDLKMYASKYVDDLNDVHIFQSLITGDWFVGSDLEFKTTFIYTNRCRVSGHYGGSLSGYSKDLAIHVSQLCDFLQMENTYDLDGALRYGNELTPFGREILSKMGFDLYHELEPYDERAYFIKESLHWVINKEEKDE